MDILQLIFLILATWRISSLLVDEPGPFEIFDRFRYRIGVKHNETGIAYGSNNFAELFTCLWCVSIWIGMVWAILFYFQPVLSFWLSLPFALSTGAIVIGEFIELWQRH